MPENLEYTKLVGGSVLVDKMRMEVFSAGGSIHLRPVQLASLLKAYDLGSLEYHTQDMRRKGHCTSIFLDDVNRFRLFIKVVTTEPEYIYEVSLVDAHKLQDQEHQEIDV